MFCVVCILPYIWKWFVLTKIGIYLTNWSKVSPRVSRVICKVLLDRALSQNVFRS